ncbi:isopentenyl phosphate kinase isoform X2 [Apium graveolens]|uniref:isopentenyl phosphate kinase isoform X2 n=1 Tax=Apium graveolens TaxID=4045 RepID=UPI003D7BB26D
MELEHNRQQASKTNKPVRCIVKLGGAAITCKNELEKINEDNLLSVCSQLRTAMMSGSLSDKVLSLDWSKRPGGSDTAPVVEDFTSQLVPECDNFVVVHGAGSFGHFQASKSGVHKGGLSQPLVKAGFVATRISVTSLNLEIVRALAREGIPSIGMSPFSCGWSTCDRKMDSADLTMITKAINSGFVPTDVLGVYDRPPSDPNAVLLREIAVREDGSWSVMTPVLQGTSKEVEITVAAHDTTGGMATKISEAAMIARQGVDVYIVKAATSHSVTALSGRLKDDIPEGWRGTVIRFVR